MPRRWHRDAPSSRRTRSAHVRGSPTSQGRDGVRPRAAESRRCPPAVLLQRGSTPASPSRSCRSARGPKRRRRRSVRGAQARAAPSPPRKGADGRDRSPGRARRAGGTSSELRRTWCSRVRRCRPAPGPGRTPTGEPPIPRPAGCRGGPRPGRACETAAGRAAVGRLRSSATQGAPTRRRPAGSPGSAPPPWVRRWCPTCSRWSPDHRVLRRRAPELGRQAGRPPWCRRSGRRRGRGAGRPSRRCPRAPPSAGSRRRCGPVRRRCRHR